ncbi:MAG: hypothetical protein H6706_04620 [Myxococcales bacterium]|nr:hypothetical protein [Myxococcales bacterium]
MMRMTSVLGLLLGLTTQAYALPTIDCADGGFLVDADLGLIAIDDEVVAIAREVQRFPGAVSPEDFCAGQGDLVAFILPVPKISPGAPPVDPDLPDPGAQPGFGGPDVGLDGGGFSMTPGAKGRPADDGADPEAIDPVEIEELVAVDEVPAAGPDADEPAPSPSREAAPAPTTSVAGAGGCAAAPGGPAPAGFLGLLALAFLVARRRGVAR